MLRKKKIDPEIEPKFDETDHKPLWKLIMTTREEMRELKGELGMIKVLTGGILLLEIGKMFKP